MDFMTLKNTLIVVLWEIQAESGLECPRLTGDTKPVGDLPEFDSLVWPVATTILATEINATIPNDVNIFVHETTKLPRSINDIAAFVDDLLKKQIEQGAERHDQTRIL